MARAGGGTDTRELFRHMTTLMYGAGTAKLIALAAIPITTRLYSPEHFGVLSVFAALVALLTPLSTLRYASAIPLAKSDRLSAHVLVLSLGLAIGSAAVVGMFIWASSSWVFSALSMPALTPYWWLIVLAILGASIYEILSSWAIRRKGFKQLARSQAIQATLGAVVKVAVGVFTSSPTGLLLGHVAQQGGGLTALTNSYFHELYKLVKSVRYKRVVYIARAYSKFPIYRLPTQLLFIFSSQAILLFSAAVFGAETTGQLGLSIMALGLPVQLVGRSLGNAYFGEISRIGKRNVAEIRSLTVQALWRVLLFSLIPFFVLALLGPFIFTTVFGEAWGQAGRFAQLLSIYLVFQFLYTSVSNVLIVLDKLNVQFQNQLFRTVTVVVVLSVSFLTEASSYITVAGYALAASMSYVYGLYQIRNILKA